jgi:hypothetical protein
VAVVPPVDAVVALDTDVAGAVKLGTDLTDLAHDELIVPDDLVVAVGTTHRQTGDMKCIGPVSKQGHFLGIGPSQPIDLPFLGNAQGLQDPIRGYSVKGTLLIGGTPF